MTRPRRLRFLVAGVVALVAVAGAATAVARMDPSLSTSGPGRVTGTEASALFELGGQTYHQVRYGDRKTLTYSFTLHNDGRFDTTVVGLEPVEHEATLLRLRGLTDSSGNDRFEIGAGDEVDVVLSMLMTDCERLSARAASQIGEIDVRTEGLGGVEHVVTVQLPEQLRTGSAREMFCPRANASTRPPG
jgi:hypothetical protein